MAFETSSCHRFFLAWCLLSFEFNRASSMRIVCVCVCVCVGVCVLVCVCVLSRDLLISWHPSLSLPLSPTRPPSKW